MPELEVKPKTPKAAAAKAGKIANPKTFKLPSGAMATELPFKGKHVKQVRRLAEGLTEEDAIFALVAVLVLVDGKPIVMEDIDEMEGMDVMFLLNKFQHLFS